MAAIFHCVRQSLYWNMTLSYIRQQTANTVIWGRNDVCQAWTMETRSSYSDVFDMAIIFQDGHHGQVTFASSVAADGMKILFQLWKICFQRVKHRALSLWETSPLITTKRANISSLPKCLIILIQYVLPNILMVPYCHNQVSMVVADDRNFRRWTP